MPGRSVRPWGGGGGAAYGILYEISVFCFVLKLLQAAGAIQ